MAAGRVYRAEDDVLYDLGEARSRLARYTEPGFAAAIDPAAWSDRLGARAMLAARLGIRMATLIAPDKLSVAGERVVERLIGRGVPPGLRLSEALDHAGLIWPGAYLRQQRQEGYRVYQRADRRWTVLGALCAFQWLASRLKLTMDYAPWQELATTRVNSCGDLDPVTPDLFERRAVPDGIVRIHANALADLPQAAPRLGAHAAWRNDAAQRPERLLLFGDEWSDDRLEPSLLTFIAALFFREVHFVWSPSIDPALVERVRPDLVIVQIAEAALVECPADDFDVDIASWQRLRAWQVTNPG